MGVLVLYGSTRRHGNTEILTELVVKDVPATRVHLSELHILPIVDQRHEPGGFQPAQDDYDHVISQVLDHRAVIFATPLYWYGMSGVMKDFVDRWSQSLRDQRYDFAGSMKEKTAYLIVTGGDNPRRKGLPLVEQFGYICDYVGMTMGGYIIGEGNRPGDVLNDRRALAEAALWNEQLRGSHIPQEVAQR